MISTIWTAPGVIYRWTLEVIVPPAVNLLPIPFARLAKDVAFFRPEPARLLAVVLGSILIVLLGLSARRRRAPLNWPLLALLFGAILIYTSIICVGRARQEVLSVTYYLYIFCLLLVTVGYALLDLDAIGSRGRMMAAIAIAGYIVVNGVGTRGVAAAIGRVNLDPSRYLKVLSDFVDEHKEEPDFSFAVSRRPQTVDPEIVLVEGYPDISSVPARVTKFSEILFAPYYDEEKPNTSFAEGDEIGRFTEARRHLILLRARLLGWVLTSIRWSLAGPPIGPSQNPSSLAFNQHEFGFLL